MSACMRGGIMGKGNSLVQLFFGLYEERAFQRLGNASVRQGMALHTVSELVTQYISAGNTKCTVICAKYLGRFSYCDMRP